MSSKYEPASGIHVLTVVRLSNHFLLFWDCRMRRHFRYLLIIETWSDFLQPRRRSIVLFGQQSQKLLQTVAHLRKVGCKLSVIQDTHRILMSSRQVKMGGGSRNPRHTVLRGLQSISSRYAHCASWLLLVVS